MGECVEVGSYISIPIWVMGDIAERGTVRLAVRLAATIVGRTYTLVLLLHFPGYILFFRSVSVSLLQRQRETCARIQERKPSNVAT